MNKVNINFKIKNNEEEIIIKDISGDIKNNILSFKYKNDEFKYNLKDNVLEKENNESILTFKFEKQKETLSKYYIKKLDFYIDAKVLTNSLITDNNNVKINYELWLNDEYAGKFEYEINIREV